MYTQREEKTYADISCVAINYYARFYLEKQQQSRKGGFYNKKLIAISFDLQTAI